MQSSAPTCVECTSNVPVLVSSTKIYGDRPDIPQKPIWLCRCGAYTGCHKGTINPVGRCAGPETRHLRMKVHALLDPIWKDAQGPRNKARRKAYRDLAEALGVPEEEAHIGYMDAGMCRRAIAHLEQAPEPEAPKFR
jgi:hypothetical protein